MISGERYKADIKISIRQFYKWLLGDNEHYPDLVRWIDTSYPEKEVTALTEAEVQRMVDRAGNIMHPRNHPNVV